MKYSVDNSTSPEKNLFVIICFIENESQSDLCL